MFLAPVVISVAPAARGPITKYVGGLATLTVGAISAWGANNSNNGFKEIENRFNEIDNRFDEMDKRMDSIEDRMGIEDQTGKRIDKIKMNESVMSRIGASLRAFF